MSKKDIIKIFTKTKYPTDKIICNHFDEIWFNDLADMIDYRTSNNQGYRYIFITMKKLSNYLWSIPFKNKYSQTITQEFSNILTTSKGKPLRIE